MDKRQKLSCVVAKLQQLVDFLCPYLPLANVHNTNFIVSRHWDSMIPEGIGRELLHLDDYQLSVLPAGELYCSKPDHGLSNSFDYDTENVCISKNSVEANSALSSKLDLTTPSDLGTGNNVTEIATVSCGFMDTSDKKVNPSDKKTDASNIITVCHPAKSDMKFDGRAAKSDHSLIVDWQHQSLREFIMTAISCTLLQLGLLTSVAELSHALGLQLCDTQPHVVVSHAMKVKKSHEVDVMCNLCAWIAKGFSISNVSIFADAVLSWPKQVSQCIFIASVSCY